jgi:hypothetical protein
MDVDVLDLEDLELGLDDLGDLDLENSLLEELPDAWTSTVTFSPLQIPLKDFLRNAGLNKDEDKDNGRIAGGETVQPMEYPSTVLFIGNNGNKCTGALVGKRMRIALKYSVHTHY